MAQVMYDRAISFNGQVYSVTQTWSEQEIIVSAVPQNAELCELIKALIRKHGQITLRQTSGVFEIVLQNA